MEKRIVECVPNFSEGRDKAVIRQITSAIESSGGVKLLDVDPGEATNRTVVTFVGSPEAVIEAAFAGVKRAAELIDMRRHKGAHPRMGATDVPLFLTNRITHLPIFSLRLSPDTNNPQIQYDPALKDCSPLQFLVPLLY